jgi:hypothetical protein
VVVWRDTKLRCGAAQGQWEGMVVEEGIRGGLVRAIDTWVLHCGSYLIFSILSLELASWYFSFRKTS